MFAPLAALVLGQALPGEDLPSTAYLTWQGWKYLGGSAATPARAYLGAADASSFATPVAEAAEWRVKVFVLRDVLRLGKDTAGVSRSDRETMSESQVAEVQSAIARFGGLLGPNVKLVPDIYIEEESLPLPYRVSPVDSQFLQGYVAPRINGGGYDAEDKVYRGPYHSVICLLPGTMEPQPIRTEVLGMPVTCLSIEDPLTHFAPGVLEGRVADVVWHDVLNRAKTHVDGGRPGPFSPEEYRQIASWDSVPGADLVRRLTSPVPLIASVPPSASIKAPMIWRSPRAQADVVDDPDKGKVMRFVFKGPTKFMGVSFPARSDGQPISSLSDGKTLSLTLKTLAKDTLAIRLQDSTGKRTWVELGRSGIMPGEEVLSLLPAAIKAEGSWETIRLDIAGAAKKAGLVDLTLFALEFSPNGRQTSRESLDPVQVDFSEISLSAEPSTSSELPVDEAEGRATAISKATAPSEELRSALGSPARLVRLNAIEAFTRVKDALAEDKLASFAIGADPAMATLAVPALANQATPTAVDALRRTLRVGITSRARGLAAEYLAESGDAKVAGDCATLLTNRSWQARVSGVRALAKLPGREAAILRLAYLAQENPEIKIAAIRSVDASDEAQVRRLLWGAVNEPFDMVRAESAAKLVASPVAEIQAEGYKVVRDESVTARVVFLRRLAEAPSENHRDALRVAIADRNAPVRAAAILAFAALEKGATAEELAPVFEDVHPEIQAALAAYGTRHALPKDVVERLRASVLPDVREVAARIKD